MENFEKKIKAAAEQYVGCPEEEMFGEEVAAFRSYERGIRSDIAKEFHTQGMYTEEEVLGLLRDRSIYIVDNAKADRFLNSKEWFEQNKKK